ncbi:hypothetical protein Bca4012_079244 [Brassica carinata]
MPNQTICKPTWGPRRSTTEFTSLRDTPARETLRVDIPLNDTPEEENDDEIQEEQEEAWSRQRRTWTYWKALKASRRSRRYARYFHKLRNKFHCPIVNLDRLWSLDPEDVKAKSTKDKVPLIDVTQHGFFKVLGKGHLPENRPFVVKAKLISKTAEKKIKEAGGAVVLTA